MADSNSAIIRYGMEVTYDVVPAIAMQVLRYTSETLKETTESVTSNEIRDDRAISDVIRTGVTAGGDINGELSYGTYDDFIRAAYLDSAYSASIADTDTTYSMDNSDNSINDSGSGFVSDGWVVGMWVESRGFTDVSNNGYFRITSVTTGKMVLSHGTVVTEAAGDTVTVKNSGHLTAGTTLSSMFIERENSDLSNIFANYTGSIPNTMNLSISTTGILTTKFGMLGTREATATATLGTGGPTAATTTPQMNSVDNVLAIFENGTALDLTEFNFDLNNNLRERLKIGTLGSFEIGKGTIDVTGSFTAYLTGNTLSDSHLDWTDSSIAVVMEDSLGNAYILDIPSIKITDTDRSTTGLNTDALIKATFTAKLHATELITLGFSRFTA